MPFKRKRIQETSESFFGCITADQWNALGRPRIKSHRLSASDVTALEAAVLEDLPEVFYKGMVSLFEGLDASARGLYSWATVKVYYAVFYFLQADMMARGIVFIRNKSLYRVKIGIGESFSEKRNYSTDHAGVIQHYKELFIAADPLLSNLIDGDLSYLWLMKKRERVNYREVCFHEPLTPDYWEAPRRDYETLGLEAALLKYLNDPFILTFQSDFSVAVLPILRMRQTCDILKKYGYTNLLEIEKRDFLKSYICASVFENNIEI